MKTFKIIIFSSLLFSPGLLSAEESGILADINNPATIKNSDQKTKKNKKPAQNTVENFSFLDMQGKRHELNNYRGKWLIINYWAIYCPPCRVEVTDIDIFARENKSKAVVLGMDAGGDPTEELLKFKKEFNLSYPLIPAQDSTLLAFGAVDVIPTTYVISPQGKLVDKHIGMITYDDLHYYTNPPQAR